MNGAAAGGYFEILKYLHEQRIESCAVSALNSAISNRNFHIEEWLRENVPELRD
jgi:hypothetical protein